MSASTSTVSEELRAAASSVSNAVDIAVDNLIQVNPETCELPLVVRAGAIVASAGLGAQAGHGLARRVHYVRSIPRVGQIAHAAIDAVATTAGGIQGMVIANDVINNRVDVCVGDAKKKALERYEAHDFKNNHQPGEVFYLINKALESVNENTIPNKIEREEYLSILKGKKEYYDKAWTAIIKAIASRGSDLSDEGIAREKAGIIKHVYARKLEGNELSADVRMARTVTAEASSSRPSVMPSITPLAPTPAPTQASTFLGHQFSNHNARPSTTASSFLNGTSVGLTSRGAPATAHNPAIRASLAAAASGQTALSADLNRRLNALLHSPAVPVAAPVLTAAASPVVTAPPVRAPAPVVFDQTAFVRAMFSSGGGGSGGIGISFGF